MSWLSCVGGMLRRWDRMVQSRVRIVRLEDADVYAA
jgi:hypothetical protein